ncbi:quinol dehydrogenase ferredoxin subunit NapH [Inmirania thermothiophila]|uniref:Ferredoxin-type protein NapH n=1 Tax=Inmirania thermothiophila TaxID=1750597 RepID=A0A3N1XZL6_9GAMM|nr:quinol dehydrogenase ferredoxin subunit NapH [Inmirania thermothiophila]ROR32043.1 ferredoxin-type protein NapH [Inmirania thermothiophila]
MERIPGREAVRVRGWWPAHKWLVLRRASQLAVLGLFLAGPWFGLWIVKGNLSSSLTLGVLPLTDPFVLAQTLAAGHVPELAALVGAGIVLAFYALVGGRVYCAWVCPVNPVTDAARWLHDRLGIRGGAGVSPRLRYWLLGTVLAVAAATGMAAWELVNPVSILHRGLIFGFGAGWAVIAAVFLADLLLARRAWCGHLCPMGAFYGLLGRVAQVRVRAEQRARCDECMDCYRVCPEPQVLRAPLRGTGGAGPVVLSGDCTNCGRCIDVCPQDVFRFGLRGGGREDSVEISRSAEVQP